MVVTTDIGRQAERLVAEELKKSGYKIISQNWRAKACEIDIVAIKDSIAYFVEVKYRKTAEHGGGFDYITPKKLKQMEFASQIWSQFNSWNGDIRLMAASVDGQSGKVVLVEVS